MLDQLARALPRLYAPVMPFLAEEVFASYSQRAVQATKAAKAPKAAKGSEDTHSVFEEGYVEVPREWRDADVARTWRGRRGRR